MSAILDTTTKHSTKLSPAMAEEEGKSRDLLSVCLRTSAQSRRDGSGTLRWKSPLMFTAGSAPLVSSMGVSAFTSTMTGR